MTPLRPHPDRTDTPLRQIGVAMMIAAALAMIGLALVAYPYAAGFGLPVQIAAHLLLPVAAVAFKLGYVVVLAGQHASDPIALAAAA